MIKYNVVYDKEKDIDILRNQLELADVIVHEVFSNLGVMSVSADSIESLEIEGILIIEEDADIIPVESFEWHQLRVVSEALPMTNFYKVTNFGDNVNVYVVDSGIDATHEEFAHTTINNVFSYNSDFTPSNGHGTAVASVIGGNTLGISKNVKLHSVKIPTGQSTTYSVLLAAFNAILDHHDGNSVAIVNCSWTVPKSQILDTKIVELQSDNLVVVAAAGNGGQAADNFSPVGLNSVLGVGASDAYDRVITSEAGGLSNWGPEVDIFAPGIDVVVAEMGGTTMETSGTSIAAAVVSGIVAQYIIENPSFTALQIQSLVIQQAREDMLFRNESIFGTTPNRIVMASALKKVISNIPEVLDIQKGNTIQFTPEFNELYASYVQFSFTVTHDETVKFVKLPDWITLENGTLTISPTSGLPSTTYMIPVRAMTADNQRIETAFLRINVYNNSPDENQSGESYRYFAEDENSPVVVTQAFCGGYGCFFAFGDCYSGKNVVGPPCTCSNSNCTSTGT